MLEQIYAFFETVPPAFDLVAVPWVVNLINGNIIILTFVYGVLKYAAVKSPWAWDDKVFTFFTGLASELKKAVPLDRLKSKKVEVAEEVCVDCGEKCSCEPGNCTCEPVPRPEGEGVDGDDLCPSCHRPI
jgi:hypothetical protein